MEGHQRGGGRKVGAGGKEKEVRKSEKKLQCLQVSILRLLLFFKSQKEIVVLLTIVSGSPSRGGRVNICMLMRTRFFRLCGPGPSPEEG